MISSLIITLKTSTKSITKHLNNLFIYILFASEIIFDFQSREILSN